VAFTTKANLERDLDKAIPFYETGMWLDDENPEPRYFLGLRLMEKGRYAEAVPYLQESISIGMAPSADFSYLASAQALNEDHEGAERTRLSIRDLRSCSRDMLHSFEPSGKFRSPRRNWIVRNRSIPGRPIPGGR
jgi:tetratricopeptide (TPR) repeat protein